MVKLNRKKLLSIIGEKGLSIGEFAKQSGISRQSIYNMFQGRSVFSVAFEKLLANLNVEFDELLVKPNQIEAILADAPENIRKALLNLQKFAIETDADLFLIGSRARGRSGSKSDWDFAIYFPDEKRPKNFSMLKQNVIERAFPYRMEIVVLNSAPSWFLKSAKDNAIKIFGANNFVDILQKEMIL